MAYGDEFKLGDFAAGAIGSFGQTFGPLLMQHKQMKQDKADKELTNRIYGELVSEAFSNPKIDPNTGLTSYQPGPRFSNLAKAAAQRGVPFDDILNVMRASGAVHTPEDLTRIQNANTATANSKSLTEHRANMDKTAVELTAIKANNAKMKADILNGVFKFTPQNAMTINDEITKAFEKLQSHVQDKNFTNHFENPGTALLPEPTREDAAIAAGYPPYILHDINAVFQRSLDASLGRKPGTAKTGKTKEQQALERLNSLK